MIQDKLLLMLQTRKKRWEDREALKQVFNNFWEFAFQLMEESDESAHIGSVT